MKRFLSCLMVLLLLVGMVPAALAAGPAVTMEVGSTSVQDGGSVTVSLPNKVEIRIAGESAVDLVIQ